MRYAIDGDEAAGKDDKGEQRFNSSAVYSPVSTLRPRCCDGRSDVTEREVRPSSAMTEVCRNEVADEAWADGARGRYH